MNGPSSGIKVVGLSKAYGNVKVIDDVSFDCPEGSITGLLGPNGSGKSTIMRMMTRLAFPDKGSVTFDGTSYWDLDMPGRVVGAMLDPGAHHPGRTVADTFATAAILMGLPLSRAREEMTMFGLGDIRRRRFGALSLGMKQRVALGIAFLGRPKYLILDEPMNGLDVETGAWLRETLVNFASESGGAVLVSTHLLQELQSFADSIVVLAQGGVGYHGPVSQSSAEKRSSVLVANGCRLRRALDDRDISYSIDEHTMRFIIEAAPRVISEVCLIEEILIDELFEVKETVQDIYQRISWNGFRVEGNAFDRH